MKRTILFLTGFVVILAFFCSSAFSYWVWTPETKKFVNPKYAVRDTPKEQFEWAQVFFDKKDYRKAIFEFDKLVKNYSHSEFAPRAQYYIGRAYEEIGDHYKAFLSYQKVIDNYPYNDKVDEIIEREYKIGNLFFSGQKTKLLGMDVLPGMDSAIEVFQKVVSNAPYGPYADLAQFRIGEAYKQLENYNEAITEFQKLVDAYPSSKIVEEARYEIALCAYKASLGADYDQETTDKAISEFKGFVDTHPYSDIAKNVDDTIKHLREKKADAAFKTAEFYKRINKPESARIYYEEIIDNFPDTSFAGEARKALDSLGPKIKPEPKKPKKITPKPEEKPVAKMAEEKVADTSVSLGDEETAQKIKEPVKETTPEVTQAPTSLKEEEEKMPGEKKPGKSKSVVSLFGYSAGSLLPASVKSIFIDNFINKIDITTETTNVNRYKLYHAGLESEITNRISDAFIKDGNLLITKREDADILLSGELINLGREPLRYDTNDNIQEYRIYIMVNLIMKNSKDAVNWSEKNFTGESTYTVVGPLAKSQDAALNDAMADLAQRVVERTIEDW